MPGQVALTAILSKPISELAAKAAVAVSRAVQGSDDTIVEHPPAEVRMRTYNGFLWASGSRA